jgi:hypothetical protein
MIDAKEIKEKLENRLKAEIKSEVIAERVCFKTLDGGYLRLDTIGADYNCVVIEYARDRRDAKNNVFEDGDLLFSEEMSEEEMIALIKEEINEE